MQSVQVLQYAVTICNVCVHRAVTAANTYTTLLHFTTFAEFASNAVMPLRIITHAECLYKADIDTNAYTTLLQISTYAECKQLVLKLLLVWAVESAKEAEHQSPPHSFAAAVLIY
jgi:hypothetical protein